MFLTRPPKKTFELIFADCKTQQTTMSYIVPFIKPDLPQSEEGATKVCVCEPYYSHKNKNAALTKTSIFLFFLILLSCSVLATLDLHI